MAKLINGNGNPAIYAGEDADLIASLAGNVTCIANVGNKYAATEEDANTIGLADGVIITKEGRRIQLDAGETDLFTIPTGSSGVTNYYIIGYKLVQNADSTQVAETFVQKMNSSSEIITENTFRGGATEVYVSLYRVTQVGFTIDSIDALLSKLLDSAAIKANIAQINTSLSAKQDKLTNPLTQSDVVNNLTSTSTTKPLSANQGKVLYDGYTNRDNQLLGDIRLRKSISSTYKLANLAYDCGENGLNHIHFTNWVDNTDFPALYGSGIILSCADASNFRILYMTTNKMWVGAYNTNTSAITWTEK